MFIERITSLQKLFPTWQIHALIVEHPIDVFYFTGLQMSAGRLIIGLTTSRLFVDGRYLGIAKSKSPIPVEESSEETQKQFTAQNGIQNIGFDSASMTYDQYKRLEKLFCNDSEESRLIAISAPSKDIRAIKTEEECEKMRASAHLTESAMRYVFENVLKEGVTEKECAWEFEKYCRERGAEKMAFDPIIAFGENASYPHHHSSDRRLQSGDPVLIDVGCVVDGYASDVTRTRWSKKVPQEFAKIHEITLLAQKAALNLCFPGTFVCDLDLAARKVMRQAGVEELFVHSLGHGIGLETHEFPRISLKGEDRDTKLQEGMVITIEPGLYVEGICGVRHEDTVIIRAEGPENLYKNLSDVYRPLA